MNLKNESAWNLWVENNQDPYGKACIDVARHVMEQLDTCPALSKQNSASDLITQADRALPNGGITGFMAGCVANMVSVCHQRGDEFKRSWNNEYGIEPEEDAKGVVNPAILTLRVEE